MSEHKIKSQECSNEFINLFDLLKEQSIFIDINFCKKIAKFENCVCKLKINNENNISYASGFFCYIPSTKIRALITNNHIINQEFLKNQKKITIYIQDNDIEKEQEINLNINRIKYTNEALDVTVIEILDEDLIDDYITVDEELIQDNEFINESVFNLHFPLGEKLKASFGKIINSMQNKTLFVHNAKTKSDCSGSPILLTKGLKIIGLHIGGSFTNNIKRSLFI